MFFRNHEQFLDFLHQQFQHWSFGQSDCKKLITILPSSDLPFLHLCTASRSQIILRHTDGEKFKAIY